jgi:hypothetical protein
MDVLRAANVLNRVERSSVAADRLRPWVEAAVRYAELRVAWGMADADKRRGMDPSRTSAHDVFVDECNILSRAMAGAGEANGWRSEIGTDRKEIGDFASLLHAALGIRAR